MRDPLPRPTPPHLRNAPGPIRVVPEPVVASPADLHARHDAALHPAIEDEQWWTPDWLDVSRTIGWWWLILGPILIILIGGPLVSLAMGKWGLIAGGMIWGLKTALFLGAAALTIVITATRRATAARKDPFCIHCGFSLVGHEDIELQCPECGRPCSRAMCDEYRKDPRFFRERYRAARRTRSDDAPFLAGEHAAPTTTDGT